MRLRSTFAALLVAGAAFCAPGHAGPLEPFQMVRSLQVLQDRIANGDHAALPMQQKLLGIIDERLRAAQPENFADRRNLRALLIYGLSGGNPKTLDMLFSKLKLEGEQAELGNAVAQYARGDFLGARSVLRRIDPMELDPEVGPPMALVAATVLATEDPRRAIGLLDDARLLSPGTLIEEAALRRSIPIAASLKDADRFTRAAEQYVRRFLRSPYAGQFADSFVTAIVTLNETVDLDVVEDVTARMSREQARVVFLRLARKSAIEGYNRLLVFASRKAKEYADRDEGGEDPRAILYANMASVTSSNVHEVLAALDGIDRQRLSAHDRELLDAALAVARAVLNRPPEASAGDTPPPARELDTASGEAAPPAPATLDPDEAYLRSMRGKLQAIDALLVKETSQ
ncbi:chemotaxis protein [Nitratireductor sp. ZSWI3]|uniref:chemotaxis protein n=1 Tax=Nitratireductor sp. ZSWI3 TaxID=2966359 RepID=UPI00214FAAC6|nr:chemotaxis protein [Nitratireductor sp. ZSWI3]MCR4264800.1 chemotaxis protein [Nitratireductor sp. ZSWI3]